MILIQESSTLERRVFIASLINFDSNFPVIVPLNAMTIFFLSAQHALSHSH
jgi:hypothetical protein